MSAPTYNYTDPVGLLRSLPQDLVVPVKYAQVDVQMLATLHTEIKNFNGYRPVFVMALPMKKLEIIISKIPKPPVGKMLINTFPPIYKERINTVGIADSPRVFPPIFITHTNS